MLPATSNANAQTMNALRSTRRSSPFASFQISVPCEKYGSPDGAMANGPGPEPPTLMASNRASNWAVELYRRSDRSGRLVWQMRAAGGAASQDRGPASGVEHVGWAF